jgi:hypothetical protein
MITKNKYVLSLPEGYEKVDSMVELLEMMPRKKVYKKENLQLIDTTIYLFSEYSERFFSRPLRASSEKFLRGFVHRGRCYVHSDLKVPSSEVERRESILMIEWLENNSEIQGRETKIKLLKQKL